MNQLNTQQFCALILSGALLISTSGPAWAAPAAIGTATSRADFQLNQRTVAASGTLHEGSSLETRSAASTLRLHGGSRLDLAPASRGQVFADRLVLEHGAVELQSPKSYRVETRDFQIEADSIQPDSPAARASITMTADRKVSVSARQGSVRVANRQGVLLARLTPGRSLLFSPPPTPSSEMLLRGTVEKVEGGFFLTDETSGVRVQLVGPTVEKYAGKKVCVKGMAEAMANRGPATVQVETIDTKCSGPVGAVPPGVSAGISKAAIIAGASVAAAATATTLAITQNSATSSGAGRGLGPQTISQ